MPAQTWHPAHQTPEGQVHPHHTTYETQTHTIMRNMVLTGRASCHLILSTAQSCTARHDMDDMLWHAGEVGADLRACDGHKPAVVSIRLGALCCASALACCGYCPPPPRLLAPESVLDHDEPAPWRTGGGVAQPTEPPTNSWPPPLLSCGETWCEDPARLARRPVGSCQGCKQQKTLTSVCCDTFGKTWPGVATGM